MTLFRHRPADRYEPLKEELLALCASEAESRYITDRWLERLKTAYAAGHRARDHVYFPTKHSLMTAVLDRQFGAIERTLIAACDEARDTPFGEQVPQFLLAACGELVRIGAAQLATGRGDTVLRRHVEQRIDAVVYQRLDALFRDGHRRGLLSAAPELLGEITRGAVERLLTSPLPRELNCTTADLLHATVDTILYGAIRPGSESEVTS